MAVPDDSETEAAAWLARLNARSVSAETVEAFYAWRRDPENGRAFARIEYLWDRSALLEGDPDIAHMVRDALGRGSGRRAPAIGRRAVLAGSIGLLGAGTAWWLLRDAHFETGIGEQRTIALDDGSKLELNTDSRVRVALARYARAIWIERGEVWLEVAQDPGRPFTVHAGGTAVTALGTKFAVRRTGGDEHVRLAEGRVEVRNPHSARPVILAPGMGIDVVAGRFGIARRIDLDRDLAWRSGHLILDRMPLGKAIDEMNRYSRQTIRLEAPLYATVPLSGTFELGDARTLSDAAIALFPLVARTGPDGGIILQTRP